MDIRKLLFIPHAITAFSMAVTLMFPCAVEAVSIGEVELHSGLGEPLLAQVDLAAENDERIEDSCLSLVAPDPLQKDAGGFLTEASLSLKTEGKRQYVIISSLRPFNNAFARLRLQVKCPGMRGSAVKTLEISPSVHEPRLGKVSAEELALLLEQQKLLVASFLDMQHQFKHLHNELEKIKAQLPQSGVRPSAASGTLGKRPEPEVAVEQPVKRQDSAYLPNELLFSALGLLALWLGLRCYPRVKSRIGNSLQQDAGTIPKQSDNMASAAKTSASPAARQPSQPNGHHAPAAPLSPNASPARNMVSPPAYPPPKKAERKVSDEDSMLEEAGLYAANGRMDKAAEILLEIIKRNPSKTDAWTLLLSVYSALCKVAEFESTAREFLKHHKASPSWSGIQVLGRTLDRDNPLYADRSSHISASPLLPDKLNLHRPIGDILVEMGILSKRDILKYLDEFDPKQHGRFGGYLVARKAITIAQLDQALLQQQGVNAEAKPGDLPSLQDIEKLLAGFDPKQHGSVSKFLASLNVVTPEQLGQLLRQPPSHGAAEKKPQADDPPAFGKLAAS